MQITLKKDKNLSWRHDYTLARWKTWRCVCCSVRICSSLNLNSKFQVPVVPLRLLCFPSDLISASDEQIFQQQVSHLKCQSGCVVTATAVLGGAALLVVLGVKV